MSSLWLSQLFIDELGTSAGAGVCQGVSSGDDVGLRVGFLVFLNTDFGT